MSRSTPALVTRMSRRPKFPTAASTSSRGGFGGADGGDHCHGTAARCGDRLDGFGCDARVNVVDDHGGALSGQFLRVAQSQAAATAGDNCYFSLK